MNKHDIFLIEQQCLKLRTEVLRQLKVDEKSSYTLGLAITLACKKWLNNSVAAAIIKHSVETVEAATAMSLLSQASSYAKVFKYADLLACRIVSEAESLREEALMEDQYIDWWDNWLEKQAYLQDFWQYMAFADEKEGCQTVLIVHSVLPDAPIVIEAIAEAPEDMPQGEIPVSFGCCSGTISFVKDLKSLIRLKPLFDSPCYWVENGEKPAYAELPFPLEGCDEIPF